jgi:hypothetical protein
MGFKRGNDIKGQLGLGGLSFDTMREATIIRVLKPFGLSNTGNIRGYSGAANQYNRGTHLVIFKINREGYYIGFSFRSHHSWEWYHRKKDTIEKHRKESFENALIDQNNIIQEGYARFRNVKYINKIGRKKFDNMFEIIKTPIYNEQ